MTLQEFRERGYFFPLGICVGLGVMVMWNIFFIYQAVGAAPVVDPSYIHAER